jgi:hypothetical protein
VKPLLVVLLLSSLGYAANGTIIQVSRKLRLSYNESMPPKDYFIDLGTRNGIKVGDVFEVTRQIPVQNSLSEGPWHLMKVTLGDIRVYAVGESTAVGHSDFEREPTALPAMEFQTFMLGDEVALKEVGQPSTHAPLPLGGLPSP